MAKQETYLNGFSVTGNGLSDDNTIILSTTETAIKRILYNPNYTIFQRFRAVAENYETLGGAGQALYRLPERTIYGTDWNELTGASDQIGGAKTTIVNLNQLITARFIYPDNDLVRLKSDINAAAGIIAQWQASLVLNKLMNYELLYLNGCYQYCIWKSQYDKSSVLVIDPAAITDKPTALKAWYSVGERMIAKTRQITTTEIGTSNSNWIVVFDPLFWMNLTHIYDLLMGSLVTAEAYATGDIYKDSILGTNVGKHYWLGQQYQVGTEWAMNKDLSWDLRGMLGLAVHEDAVAMPLAWQKTFVIQDPRTGNTVFNDRSLFAYPEPIRGNLVFVILDHEPTQDEIDYATSMIQPMVQQQGLDLYEDNLKYAFQLTPWDRALIDSKNEDGSTNLKLNINRAHSGKQKDIDYIIHQAMGKLNIQKGEIILVANATTGKKAGDKLTDTDIKAIACTDWDKLVDGTEYFMAVLKKNAVNDYTFVSEVKYKVLQSDATFG